MSVRCAIHAGTTLLVTCLLTGLFAGLTVATIAVTGSEPLAEGLVCRALTTAGTLALAQVGYCGLFGVLGLLMRRSLLAGVAYIILFEGLLASLDTVARRLTVMYYFRVLTLRWLAPADGFEWSINLDTAPDVHTCVLTLLGVGLGLTVMGALLFTVQEVRMKTPEGG